MKDSQGSKTGTLTQRTSLSYTLRRGRETWRRRYMTQPPTNFSGIEPHNYTMGCLSGTLSHGPGKMNERSMLRKPSACDC